MNNKIKKGKLEYEKGNYESALSFLDDVKGDDIDYRIALTYKISCYISLKDYDAALNIINPLISEDPYSEFLWFNKVMCHVFSADDEKAHKALSEAERVVDEYDKNNLLFIAKMYNMVGDEQKALEYCDKALAIDEDYVDALREKSLVSIGLQDDNLINEVADQLLSHADGDILSRMPIFLLKLFSNNFEDCYELLINSQLSGVSEDFIDMFKGAIFNHICDNFKINLLVVNADDMPLDDALHVLFDYINTGRDHGNVGEVHYFILQST